VGLKINLIGRLQFHPRYPTSSRATALNFSVWKGMDDSSPNRRLPRRRWDISYYSVLVVISFGSPDIVRFSHFHISAPCSFIPTNSSSSLTSTLPVYSVDNNGPSGVSRGTMPASDWSLRYLSLGTFSTGGTAFAWVFDSTFVIYVALATVFAFTTLALFHAHRLRTRFPRRKTDRPP